MKYRILLVDDEIDILEFIRYNLVKEGYEVFTAANGAEGLEVARRCQPHLILLDMMMPVMDGIQTCRAIRQDPAFTQTMVVFLSALGDEAQQLNGFDVGADDYLTKPIKIKLLISRLQALLKRVPLPEQEPANDRTAIAAASESTSPASDQAHISIDRNAHTVQCNGRTITLPRKEFALLELLCSSPGTLISREEIYTSIWGTDVVVGDRTIDVHIRKLRQKIGEHHIVTVKGIGYRFEP